MQMETEKDAAAIAKEQALKAGASKVDETQDDKVVSTGGDTTEDDLGWNDKQKAYIESLRKENAKYRTKSKELETQFSSVNDRFSKLEKGLKGLFGEGDDEKLTPEQRVEALTAQNEGLAINTALVEAALEYGVGKEDFSYFKFLVTERLQAMDEGEELSEEELEEMAKSSRRKAAMSSTSVDGGGKSPESPGSISLESFQAMGIMEKSVLYQNNPKLYEQLTELDRSAKRKK